ncbi:MAG: hypothetical protein K0B00_11410 [Rhodobacteraceae bacterium]|nr:hypothetical protein [Paracoccaceae bacterium]
MRIFVILLELALMFAPKSAFADTWTRLVAIQLRLSQVDCYAGEADGKFGPETQRAFSAYAADHGVKPIVEDIYRKLAETALLTRRDLTDGEMAAAVDAVKEQLLDPYSADVVVEFGYPGNREIVVACGRVNAKNRYGGYVGFKWFTVTMMQLPNTVLALTPTLNDELAFDLCQLGTYPGATVR